MLVHARTIIKKAQKGGYAVGAFNFYNFETLMGIVKAAARKKSPVILETSENNIKYMGLDNIVALVESVAMQEGRNVPMALHLDHGYNYDLIRECIKAGFSSVQMDGSFYSWQKNVRVTKRVVDYAHRHRAWVQGEVGGIMGKKGLMRRGGKYLYEYHLTDPDKAKEFVKLTKVDTLAISVGTLHGMYRGQEKIDFKRLRAIKDLVSVPLVLHGTSGLSNNVIAKAAKRGIKVFNIATETRKAFLDGLRRGVMKKDPRYNLRNVLLSSQLNVVKRIEFLIDLLGSKNKA